MACIYENASEMGTQQYNDTSGTRLGYTTSTSTLITGSIPPLNHVVFVCLTHCPLKRPTDFLSRLCCECCCGKSPGNREQFRVPATQYRQRRPKATVQKLKHVGNTLLGFEAACLTASVSVGWVAFLLSVGTGWCGANPGPYLVSERRM